MTAERPYSGETIAIAEQADELGRGKRRDPFGTKPGKDAVLRRMRQLHRKPRKRDRLSYPEIARRLNDEGRRTRYGQPWTAANVWKILRQ